jgi:hypothetical protein
LDKIRAEYEILVGDLEKVRFKKRTMEQGIEEAGMRVRMEKEKLMLVDKS